MATVHDLTTSAYNGNYGSANENTDRFSIKKRYVDCATDAQTSTEYYHLFYVAANSIVKTHMITATVEGAAETADVYFVAATDTAAASGTILISSHNLNVDDTCNAGTEIFTDVAGYISVKPDNNLGTCAYYVVAEILQLSTDD